MQTKTKSARKSRATKAIPASVESLAPLASHLAPAILAAPIAEKPETETANPADKRAQYIEQANAARALFNKLAESVRSIPIKPANGFKAKPLNPKNYELSIRGAAAIAIACAANGGLRDNATFPRRFYIGAVPYIIENGAFSDFIGTAYNIANGDGLGAETFTLLPGSSAAIRSKLGAIADNVPL